MASSFLAQNNSMISVSSTLGHFLSFVPHPSNKISCQKSHIYDNIYSEKGKSQLPMVENWLEIQKLPVIIRIVIQRE